MVSTDKSKSVLFFPNVVVIQILFYLLFIPVLWFMYLQDLTGSLYLFEFMVIVLLCSIFIFNYMCGIYINSLYSLFLITFTLFICGRVISHILSHSVNAYSLDFFALYTLNEKDAIKLLIYVLLFLCALDLGYKFSFSKKITLPACELNEDWCKKFCMFALMLSPIYLFELTLSAKEAFTGGYLSSKLWQAQGYSFPLSSLAQTFFNIGLAYAIATGFKRKLYIAIYIYIILCATLIGARGPIVSGFLFLIWLWGGGGKRDIGIIKLGLLGVGVIFCVSFFIQMFSFRADGNNFDVSLMKFISDFLYNQGISLMVFDASTKVTDYPVLAYFQNFIPGISAIASLFYPVDYVSSGFQYYMSNILDPILFSQGFGLDWTLLSDLYVFGGQNIIGYTLLAFLFGFLMSSLQNSTTKIFWYVFTVAIFTRLIFLPRSTFSSLFPFCMYFFILIYFLPRFKIGNGKNNS
ncbi:O-antigen polysaccharide polymerase Wzy [Citrobacter freundii]|nr:O-antigen polysaccharide polymerase Wzy [Citrobacter freundii]